MCFLDVDNENIMENANARVLDSMMVNHTQCCRKSYTSMLKDEQDLNLIYFSIFKKLCFSSLSYFYCSFNGVCSPICLLKRERGYLLHIAVHVK